MHPKKSGKDWSQSRYWELSPDPRFLTIAPRYMGNKYDNFYFSWGLDYWRSSLRKKFYKTRVWKHHFLKLLNIT